MRIIFWTLLSLVSGCLGEPYTKPDTYRKTRPASKYEYQTKGSDEKIEKTKEKENKSEKRTSDDQHDVSENTSTTDQQQDPKTIDRDASALFRLGEKEVSSLEDHTEQELKENRTFSKVVIKVVNQLRTNPQEFKKHVIVLREKFIKNQASDKSYYIKNTPEYKLTMHTKEGLVALDEAIAVLDKMPKTATGLRKLGYNEVLLKSSLLHAKCMKEDQFFGHYNEKRRSLHKPWDRVMRYCKAYTRCAENLWCGAVHDDPTLEELARMLVVDLFVDDGVLDRGHRKALVDSRVTDLGVAFFPYDQRSVASDQRKYTFVMNFGAGIEV